jgi:hypothetical protein
MNIRTRWLYITLVLFAALILAGCSSARVGTLQRSAHAVELGDGQPVRVKIDFGAGNLNLAGGAEKLLEGDFTYNVARLTPEMAYMDGLIVLRQPDIQGLPILGEIKGFRNEWSVRLHDEVPMDLRVNMGAGTSYLQLVGLSLTRLYVNLGAGTSTVDLSGGWARDLQVTIDSGAAAITVRLPREVGARVEVDRGPTTIKASGLRRDGDVFTNEAYGVSEVTLHIDLDAGIGEISLEVE